jgi:transcriptional regulator with XRE-family HTH domain
MLNIERIIELRKARNWGQRQLAKEANVAHTVISRLEARTQKDITLSALTRIALALNVTIESLLDHNVIQPMEIDLIPELQSVIRQLKTQPELIQRQATGILRGFLENLE